MEIYTNPYFYLYCGIVIVSLDVAFFFYIIRKLKGGAL